jgi:hypothetical protein
MDRRGRTRGERGKSKGKYGLGFIALESIIILFQKGKN